MSILGRVVYCGLDNYLLKYVSGILMRTEIFILFFTFAMGTQ